MLASSPMSVRMLAARTGDGSVAGRGHEPGGLLTGIQVRDPAGGPGGDEPAGDRVGGGRVQGVDVGGERAHGREPLGVPGPGGPGRGGRERDRGGHGDPGLPAGVQAVQERSEQLLASFEPVAAGPPPGQVARDRRAQVRAHRGSPLPARAGRPTAAR